jgi:uncharacterized protein YndB with AHSA1/START domain
MPDAAQLAPVIVSVDIHVPIRAVWDEITKTGQIQRAIYNTVLECDLRPGARLRYYSPDKKRVFVVGEVLEVTPPRMFKHTYHFMMNGVEPPTTVTWELAEIAGGTRVTLTHEGFTAAHKAADKQAAGWREIVGLLKAELETGTLPLKTRLMYGMMGATMFMLPKTTKVAEVERAGF